MSHKKYRQETDCLNCGATVERKFCPECGQENVETRDNFVHMVGHFIADYLHYDSKFLRSLKLLITAPGFLTRQYLDGKRAGYIHPLRLFFFVTIIMVILANLYYKKYEQVIKDERIRITSGSTNLAPEKFSTLDTSRMQPEENKILTGTAAAFDKVSHYLKYISFFLLPVYALGFSMLYARRKHYYVDHLVHTIHLQSFAYIALSLLLLFPLYILPSSRDWFMKVLIGVTALYIVFSLRHLYGQPWGKTIAKALLATLFMFFVTMLVVMGFIVVSIFA